MLSVCIITKNEQNYLEECLKRCSRYPVEVVVVDTGSTDHSKEIAANYTDQIYDFVWCDDFSAARNFAASKAHNDVIIAVDSDEWIEKLDPEQIERIMQEFPQSIGRLTCISEYTLKGKKLKSVDHLKRIYDRRFCRFEGKVHEQIVNISGCESKTFPAEMIVDHRGYDIDSEQKQKKTERNLKLLKAELTEHPKDTYLLYQIGKSYYFIEDYVNAVDFFCQALDTDWDPRNEYCLDLLTCLGYALVNCGLKEAALELEKYWEYYPNNADYTYMMGYIYMQNARFEQAIDTFLQATNYAEGTVQGTNSYLAYYNAAVILDCMGRKEEAEELYQKSRDLSS